MSSTALIVHTLSLQKYFGEGPSRQQVLRDVTLEIPRSAFTAIVGKSGSGKSTLLNILAGLETADSGEIVVCGTNLAGLSQEALARFRLERIGLVFQFFNLLPTLTLRENVAVAGQLAGRSRSKTMDEAGALLEEVGLSRQMDRLPDQVSGGENQRAAVARALVGSPELILADEPTGSLDRENADAVIDLFRGLNERRGVSILLVTHDPELEQAADRVFRINDGRIVP